MFRPIPRKRQRTAFTLIELLTVLAIMMLLGSLVFALKPDNPEGLVGARRVATSLFRVAQLSALQSPNPDRNPVENPLFNIRARVLILNDPENQEQHLRRMRVVIGGTRRQQDAKPADYRWYATEQDTTLPKGVYMISPTAPGVADKYRSRITPNDSTSHFMRFNLEPSLEAQPEGTGDKEWYFYEFNNDGTSNMKSATLMLADGEWDPTDNRVIFRNTNDITGFWLSPSGKTVFYSDMSEMDKK